MRRLVSILMLLVMTAFATGLLFHLHMRQHEQEEAMERVIVSAIPDSQTPAPAGHHHEHSEENCPLCAQFHAPIISMFHVVVLVDSGQCVYSPAIPAISQQSQGFGLRISCRGPPAPTC